MQDVASHHPVPGSAASQSVGRLRRAGAPRRSAPEIAERIDEGETDDEIRAYFAAAYGEEILLTPPASGVGCAGVDRARWSRWSSAAAGLVFAFRRWRAWE